MSLLTLGLGDGYGAAVVNCSHEDPSGDTIVDAYNAARAARGVNVTYNRGVDSVALLVVPGRTSMELETTPGIITTVDSRDFLVLASELVLSAVTTLPERRDWIEYAGNRLEVMSPDGDRFYRYSDPYELILRIHTKGT